MTDCFLYCRNRPMGRRFFLFVVLTLCVFGSLFLLCYFQFAATSVDMIQTVPVCENCNRETSVNNSALTIDYCNLNQTFTSGATDLLILVPCHFNDAKSRAIIRQTWGGLGEQQIGRFRVVFVVGRGQSDKLASEQSTYGDILQVDAPEAYRKLTEKVTQAFLWFHKRCHNIKYVFKTDTDVFVNVPFIFRIIKQYYVKNTIVGHCFESFEKPDRRKKSKWRVSVEEYAGSHYPPYCSGSGYLMERATASKLSGMFKDTPMFPMEDVYMGFCAHKAKIDVVEMSGFHLIPVGYDDFLYCHCLGVVHRLNSGKQREIWRRHELSCGFRWSHWSGYPMTCYLMTSQHVVIPLAVAAFIVIVIGTVIVYCRKRLKNRH